MVKLQYNSFELLRSEPPAAPHRFPNLPNAGLGEWQDPAVSIILPHDPLENLAHEACTWAFRACGYCGESSRIAYVGWENLPETR